MMIDGAETFEQPGRFAPSVVRSNRTRVPMSAVAVDIHACTAG